MKEKMKKQYMKPMIMVHGIEQMSLLAGSDPSGFSNDLDSGPVDGPSALSRGNGFKSCWED